MVFLVFYGFSWDIGLVGGVGGLFFFWFGCFSRVCGFDWLVAGVGEFLGESWMFCEGFQKAPVLGRGAYKQGFCLK